MKSLDGIVILDLTHMLSGPYGSMILTDLGARTIKVEPPVTGEGTRQLLASNPDYSRQGMGAYFLTLNRSKESVCIDLKSDTGREIFYDLVRKADVVIDNYSVGVTKRLKVDHDTLAAINPRVVTCSVSGFGETGPDTNRPAFDMVVQGMGGGMSISGFKDSPPVRSGIPIGDLGGGVFGVVGVLAALLARGTTGRGQHVDVSMLDVQISLLNYMATMYLMSDIVPERLGNSHFVHVPYDTFETSDGYVIIACIGDAFYRKLTEVLPIPGLLKPEYLAQPNRFRDRHLINGLIQDYLCSNTTEYWLALLREQRIPCAPVNDFGQALNDRQIRARNMVVDVTLQSGDTVQMPGNPVKLSESREESFMAPPLLGEHTDRVLAELLGYDATKIETLKKSGVIQ